MNRIDRPKVEFLVCSDLHFHAHSQYAEDTEKLITNTNIIEGVNSRLCNTVNSFISMIDYAEEHNITHMLCAGDLVHDKKRITKDVLNALVYCFQYAQDRGMYFHIIAGNHDQANKDGSNNTLALLDPFDNVCIVPGFSYSSIEGVYVLINSVPYTENTENFIKQVNDNACVPSCSTSACKGDYTYCYRVLLAHIGIKGAKVGSDYVLIRDEDLDITTINYESYDACFFGHYHEHQKVFANGWIPGALEEHNWSDAGGKRGFCHVTLEGETVDIKHIPTARTNPRFKLLDINSSLEDIKPWDFIRYKTKESITEEHKNNIEGMIAIACGGEKPKWLEIIPEKVDENKEEFILPSKATSAESILDEWVNHSKIELDHKKVIQLGQEILSEARDSLL